MIRPSATLTSASAEHVASTLWILDTAENKMLVEHWEMGFYNRTRKRVRATIPILFCLQLASVHSRRFCWQFYAWASGLSIRQGGEFKTSQSTTRPCFDEVKRTLGSVCRAMKTQTSRRIIQGEWTSCESWCVGAFRSSRA